MKKNTVDDKLTEIIVYLMEMMRTYQIISYDKMEIGRNYTDEEMHRNYDDYKKLRVILGMLGDLQDLIMESENNDL